MDRGRTNFINYSWQDTELDCTKLRDYIIANVENAESSKVILLAIARSGSIPATLVSNKLKIENKVFTCNYTRYQTSTIGKQMQVIQNIPIADIKQYISRENTENNKNENYIFIIDAIADKGETIKMVIDDLISGLKEEINSGVIKKIKTLALCKMTAVIDYSVRTASKDDWITLPWEG